MGVGNAEVDRRSVDGHREMYSSVTILSALCHPVILSAVKDLLHIGPKKKRTFWSSSVSITCR